MTRAFVKDYLGHDFHDIVWTLARMGMRSPAQAFVMPMQDVLGLSSESRMNTPGTAAGNWTWRLTEQSFEHPGKDALRHFTWLYQRNRDQQQM